MILGIGSDIVDVGRIQHLLDAHGQRFLDRVFSREEQAYCMAQPVPAINLAARFAAKEAALKALGTGLSGGMRWTDVAVERSATGAPALVFSGKAAGLAAARNVTHTHVSLSHTDRQALAFTVLETRAL